MKVFLIILFSVSVFAASEDACMKEVSGSCSKAFSECLKSNHQKYADCQNRNNLSSKRKLNVIPKPKAPKK